QATGLLPQVFMLLWHLAKKRKEPLTAQEAVKLELMKPRQRSLPKSAFAALVQRARDVFYSLGVPRSPPPLSVRGNKCHCNVRIDFARQFPQ
ncbi:MAG: hypothetical protein ACYS99_00670, partial [Planctomycetota bacterium]